MLDICFLTPKGTSLRRTVSFDILCVIIGSGALAVERWKNPQKKPSKHLWCAISSIREKETP